MLTLGQLEHGAGFSFLRDPSITGKVDRSREPPHGGFVYAFINGESKYLSKQTYVTTMNQESPLRNALQDAIIKAELAKPMSQMEIVWRCVKEMQPVDYKAVMKRTKLPQGIVSTTLSQMEKRGMVYSRGAKGDGFSGTRKEFLTDMDTYKRLPVPDNQTSRPYVQPEPKPKRVIHIKPVQTVQNVTQSNTLDVDKLTIAEARQLWAKLDRMFGGNV